MSELRTLPHDLEAETSVLGAILIDNSVYAIAAGILQSSDFFRNAHRHVFECLVGLTERSVALDLVTVKESLERNGLLDKVGGPAYLASLVDGIPRSTNVEYYAGIVKEKALTRRLIVDTNNTLSRAYSEEAPASELARQAIDNLSIVSAGGDGSEVQPVVVTMSDVRPEAIRWLWPGRLAFGKLTILSGDPGLGKSFITLDLAARASAGHSWPDGARALDPLSVMVLSAEDGLGDTLRPRLDKLGANVARVHVMTGIKSGVRERGPQLADVASIEAAILATGSRLLIIDPVSSYLGAADSHKDSEVRGVLTPLVTMAERHQCAVLGVMHLTKDGGKAAIYRASGSVAFVAQARVGLMVTSDPGTPDRRVLAVSKINIEKVPSSLAYTLTNGCLEWDATPLADFDLNHALAASSSSAGRDKTEQTDAEQVIQELLADESIWPLSAKDALGAGSANGINERTMQRAAGRLKITIKRMGFGPGSKILWHRPSGIHDTIPDKTLGTHPLSSMSSMVDQAGNSTHTHIDDSNGSFPRAREEKLGSPFLPNGGNRVNL
jgi:hypothetical protein